MSKSGSRHLRSDSVLGGDFLLLVDIHLREGQTALLSMLFGELFEDRSNHMTWSTPYSMKVNYDILVLGEDGLEL